MLWLPDGEIFLEICLFVLTECTNVTDRQTHTHRMTAKVALAQHRVAKTVLTLSKEANNLLEADIHDLAINLLQV